MDSTQLAVSQKLWNSFCLRQKSFFFFFETQIQYLSLFQQISDKFQGSFQNIYLFLHCFCISISLKIIRLKKKKKKAYGNVQQKLHEVTKKSYLKFYLCYLVLFQFETYFSLEQIMFNLTISRLSKNIKQNSSHVPVH